MMYRISNPLQRRFWARTLKKNRLRYILLFILVIQIGLLIYVWKIDEMSVSYLDIILPESQGVSVIFKNADDPLWRGESTKAEQTLELLIAASRDLNIFDAAILPIHFHVNESVKQYGGSDRIFGRSFLVLGTYHLGADRDETLVHEFAHLLTQDDNDKHGSHWRSTCMTLLRECNKRKRADQLVLNSFACTP